MTNIKPKIFVSHSSLDDILVRSFVNNILILGNKLNEEGIFCTSIEGMGIESGADFREKIKSQLEQANLVIQLITENYKNSEVCLNEMGAAWVLNAKVIPFILEPINYSNVGFIHNPSQMLKINKKNDLLKLSTDISQLFNLDKPDADRYNQLVDDFLILTKRLKKNPKKIDNLIEIDKSYFNRYLNKDADLSKLFMMSQPNLADCIELFRTKYAEEIYYMTDTRYMKQIKGNNEYLSRMHECVSYEITEVTYSDLTEKYGRMENNAFFDSLRTDTLFYSLSFIDKEGKPMVGFAFWAFVNNRWIFFPKPWQIVRKLNSTHDNEIINKAIKAINRIGVGKLLREEKVNSGLFAKRVMDGLLK